MLIPATSREWSGAALELDVGRVPGPPPGTGKAYPVLCHMLDTHLRLEAPVRHHGFSPQAPWGHGSSPLAVQMSAGQRSGSAASSPLTLTLTRAAPGAAAAKSFQSCLTLCDPIDGSPPGSPVPGILQVRTLEWVAISFSNA